MTENKLKLITHSGSFHTDDVFACAALSIMLEREGKEFEIIRTRDEDLINGMSKDEGYVFDVGGVYDPENNRLDHHQPGGAAKRENGLEYASFGLVWKKFGSILAGSEEAAKMIDQKLVSPIDAHDNGVSLYEKKQDVAPYVLQNIFFAMYPTWKEEDEDIDQIFLKAVDIAKHILSREITQTKDRLEAVGAVLESYQAANDKRIIIVEKNYPCEETLKQFPEPIYVVYPRRDGTWGAKTMKDDITTFKNRKDLPAQWGGLKDADFVKITGVDDAVFCHRALYFAIAKSKEGAIKLAQIALVS